MASASDSLVFCSTIGCESKGEGLSSERRALPGQAGMENARPGSASKMETENLMVNTEHKRHSFQHSCACPFQSHCPWQVSAQE